MKYHICRIKRDECKKSALPARVYGYLSLCVDLKEKMSETGKNAVVILGNLPFVSEMLKNNSHEALRHAYWAFLRY